MQVKFFLFQCSNKRLDQRDALPSLLRTVHEKSVVPVLLKFRRFFAKRAANTLAKLQLCPSPGCVKVREAFSAYIFHLCKKFLELSDTTGELFNRDSFRPRAVGL